MMKRLAFVSFLFCTLLALSGCETWESVKQKFNTIDWSFAADEPAIVTPETRCPEVRIVDELSSLTEFAGEGHTDSQNQISQVFMTAVNTACQYSQKNVAIDLKLEFKGTLGPKAKVRQDDKPFFSYPFFVAVLSEKEEILAKEVFSASLSYGRDEQSHTYYESLRQIIPFDDAAEAPGYKVLIGFQLTQDQLAYNRAHQIPVAPTSQKPPTISPDW